MKEDKYLLADAIREIKLLKHTNQILDAQASVVQVFAYALGLRPNNTQGMEVDVLYYLEERLRALKEAEDSGHI